MFHTGKLPWQSMAIGRKNHQNCQLRFSLSTSLELIPVQIINIEAQCSTHYRRSSHGYQTGSPHPIFCLVFLGFVDSYFISSRSNLNVLIVPNATLQGSALHFRKYQSNIFPAPEIDFEIPIIRRPHVLLAR